MTFLAPQALWLLALLPVVVALHFLRARRRRRDVAGLFLWRRAQAAVARRRRFSPSWLLALQLLFVAAAALGLARPHAASGEEPAVVVVIDASASMAASMPAAAGGGTRLAAAADLARAHLTRPGPVALLRAGLTPRSLVPLAATADERLAALAALQAGDAEADLPAAIDLGTSLLPGAEVLVYTDRPQELGRAQVVVVADGTETANVGISAFDVGVGQAFVAIAASGRRPAEVTVGLFADGQELARSTLLVPGGSSGSVTFPLLTDSGAPPGLLEARILAPQGDALALDDVAFAGRRALTVVTEDLYQPLLRALQAIPEVSPYGAANAENGAADLRVLSRRLSEAQVDALPPGNYILMPPPAQDPEYHVVRDYDRAAAVMRFVDLREALVGIEKGVEPWPASGEASDGASGWRILARADDLTPLLRVRQSGSVAVLQLAFHPSQSDVVLRPAFPALLANWASLQGATPRVRLGETLPGTGEVVLEPGVYTLPTQVSAEGGAEAAPASGAVGQAGAAGQGAAAQDGNTQDDTAQDGAAPASSPPTGSVALAALLSADESRLGTEPQADMAAGAPDAPAPAPAEDQAPAALAAQRSPHPGGAPSAIVLALLTAALVALAVEWWLYSGGRWRRLVG